MLKITDLKVAVDGKMILQGLNLEIQSGEVHVIMGPNGSGKSTLAQVLAGRDEYQIEGGDITYQGAPLIPMPAEQRAQAGIFLSFQYPVEVPGISNLYFFKAAYNAIRKARGESECDAADFLAVVRSYLPLVEMDMDMLYRSVNEGFSGGEKKRNEILQMLLLNPTLAILDEIDSGLDIDALRIVAEGINSMRKNDKAQLLITHYQRLLDYVKPDYVHVLHEGKIIRTGGMELAQQLEQRGYSWLLEPTTYAT